MRDGWDTGLETFATLEAFYDAADPQARRRSGEADFGVWWWDGRQGYSDQWRVSCVANTGEIYAVMERGHLRDSKPRVVLLGKLGGDDLGYAKSNACLEGWADVCGGPESLQWAVDRVLLATGMIAAVEAPLVSETGPVSAARLRELYAAWQAETNVPGSAATAAFEALEEVIFESLPPLLADAEALDQIQGALSVPTWPGGADFLEWTAALVRNTGRVIE